MTANPLTLRHFLLALAVVFVWGTNFVIVKYTLHDMPPLLFAALRFTAVSFPAIFLLKRPNVSWGNLAAYGVFIGGGQFGAMFYAMKADISPGLASLVVQSQVFFTIGLSMLINGDRMRAYQVPALLLALAGILVIGMHTDATTTLFGLGLTLCAGFSWASGNILGKRAAQSAENLNMLAYVVWSSPFAALSLTAATLLLETPVEIGNGLMNAGFPAWAAVVWQAAGNTMFGYAAWAWLLSRYPASTITPMSLLVPVFGMSASTLILAEPMPGWKIGAASMVMGGLAVNILWPRILRRLRRA